MQRISLYLFIILLYSSCTEVPVVLPDGINNNTGQYAQNVLIEEYTGVRCQNCPAGAKQISELKKIHKERLIAISIHGGFFARPTNLQNKYTLDNSFGKALITLYNEPLGYPSAIINRKSFDNSFFVNGNTWAGYVNAERNKSPSVGIELNSTISNTDRKITISTTLFGLSDLSNENLQLSIVLVENNIKDAQLTPTGVDTNYIHQYVMRSFAPNVQGRALTKITNGSQQTLTSTLDIPKDWNIKEIKTVAIVHKPFPSGEVINVIEK